MHDRPLDHALEPQRGLGIDVLAAGHRGRMFGDELAEVLAQFIDVCAHRAHDLGGSRVVQQGKQQMLDRDELVAFLTRFDKGHVQAYFQLLRNHLSPRCRGTRRSNKLYTKSFSRTRINCQSVSRRHSFSSMVH